MTDILLNMLGAATAAILLGTFHAVWLEWKREKLAAAYDERVTALTRKHEPQRFVGDLLKAEISEKQRNVVPRLESESELALLPQAEAQTPAAPIRRSVTPDYLICLEDGKQFKSLRRHLGGTRSDPGTVSQEMEAAFRLSYGRAQLPGPAIGSGEKYGVGSETETSMWFGPSLKEGQRRAPNRRRPEAAS